MIASRLVSDLGKGFGIAPLVLAPLSEEYGRKWTYVIAVAVFTILHFMMTL